MLTRYLAKRKVVDKVNLFDDSKPNPKEKTSGVRPIISYWWPNISLSIVATDSNLPRKDHPRVSELVRLDSPNTYLPIFYQNDFYMFTNDLIEINETVSYFFS